MSLRVAIVHEWLDTLGGSEKVLEQLLLLFPHSDLFATVDFLPPSARGILHGRNPYLSFMQRLPFARKKFRSYLPLMPLAAEQHDLSGYDLIISNSHSFAKGVISGPGQAHICYCHTPMRYAWDLQHQYLRSAGLATGVKSWLVRSMLHYLRIWDARTVYGVDQFLTNSTWVAQRIRKTYGRDASVIHPPVDTEYFQRSQCERESWYVTASRLAPYKRVDVIVKAFAAMPERKLLVIGDGPQMRSCRKMATSNITFAGHVGDAELKDALQRARAFVFAAEEDFGIAPVEAQACGTPVICYGKGGVLDSVIDGMTGLYFEEQTPESLCEAVRRFETMRFNEGVIRDNAERFSADEFRTRFLSAVEATLNVNSAAGVYAS